jgi:hypothetical protein
LRLTIAKKLDYRTPEIDVLMDLARMETQSANLFFFEGQRMLMGMLTVRFRAEALLGRPPFGD